MIKHILLDYDSVIVEGWLRTLELEQTYEYVYVHNDFRAETWLYLFAKINYRELPICNMYTRYTIDT